MKRHLTLAASLICLNLFSQVTLAGTLTDSPLFLQTAVPSNVLFPLSVEFPTANTAAYQGSNDYNKVNTYLGFFANDKCYTYDTTNQWFSPAAKTTDHTCSNQWSGNFLNWATMTGLDEFRFAMTGGNRYQDTATLTVLERAYQSGQGGTSNFTNKTYSGTDATPYPLGSNLTIVNQGKGTKMTVTLGGAGTANCTSPRRSSGSPATFACDFALEGTLETGTCATWTGDGTVSSPYKCQTFGNFTDSGVPSASTASMPTSVSSVGSETVSCTSPTYSSTASPKFACTLTNSSSTAGSCTTWIGDGTLLSPFTCTTFGTFGSTPFSSTTVATAATFTSTVATTQPADSISSCSIEAASPHSITCNLASARVATCARPSGDGKSSITAYTCSSWTIGGTPAATFISNINSSSTTSFPNSSGKTRYYYAPTSITYKTPVSTTLYYTPSYTGSSAINYYYYATYGVSFGGSTDFYVRAKVCVNDSSIGGTESNCKPYGTSFKPTGVIHDYGEQMRFGVFSYFKDNTIDNAVMRSKLKFVAPNKWTSSGSSISNANKEWSATDGTYLTNPDPTEATASHGGAVTNSGVINYINKFGASAGGYKTYDNVGKLYYEALKYLRGLSPTSDFYSGATTANNDNFPVITSWDDPVQYSCQKNFIMTMGDTHTWCDKRLPGGTYSTTGNGVCDAKTGQLADKDDLASDTDVNVSTWTNAIGTLEGRSSLATTMTGAGGASFYMSGLSYWAAYNGIRPKTDLTSHVASTTPANNIKVKTYVVDVQENKDLGVNSQYWYAAKYGGVDSFDASGKPQDWSTTVSGYTGAWPKTLLPAGNPAAMIAAVRGAMASISAQIGSGSDVGLSTGDLRTGTGINLYSASYNSGGWTGDVTSYRMASDLSISATPTWTASSTLSSAVLNSGSGTKPWTARKIITFNDGLNANGTANSAANGRRGVDFTANDSGTDVFETNFSPRQQAFLNTDPGSNTTDWRGDARVDFLRGDNSNESPSGFGFRPRVSALGDFVNSAPVYVAFPAPFVNGSNYSTYATNVATRTPMLYAGANDGMLHAFNADANSDGSTKTNSGKEIFAYVPSAVYTNLTKLSWTNYAHKYFVDGTPVVADAQLSASCVSASDTNKCWRTILTGGLGAGGQGIYALNITDPSTFSSASAAAMVLWEFTDRDDADLGYTFVQPLVRKMNNGKWAVIIGNGYNSTDGDNDVGGINKIGSGRAYLYILYLDGPGVDGTGRGKAWTLGTDYLKIELKSPTESTNPAKNGLSSVAGIDYNSDGTVDYLYAGDRHGNLWKIDVSSTNPASWAPAFGTTSDPTPLFTATTADTTPAVQQITTSPLVTRHPNGGLMVLFGSGSYVDQSDNYSPFSTNSFYGIWDKNDGSTTVTGRSQLQKQATLAINATGGDTFALQSDCAPQYNATATDPKSATMTCPSSLAPATNGSGKVDQQLGWVLDLKNTPASSSAIGERYISSALPILANGLLTFVTLTPSGDACAGGGYDFQYDLDYRTGGAFATPIYFTVSGTSTTPLLLSFTTGSGSTALTESHHPSGQKLTTATGQNPKDIGYQTDPESATPTTGGCTGLTSGRPCVKEKKRCTIGSVAAGCRNGYYPPTGRISWRQLTQ